MWNTNQELANRLSSLEKYVERFSQSVEPKNWYFEGQLFWDKTEKVLKAWDWTEFVPIWSDMWYWQDYDNTWAWAYSAWTFNYTIWFKPRLILVKWTHSSDNEWLFNWSAVINEDGSIEQWCTYQDWSFWSVHRTVWDSVWVIKASSLSTVLTITNVTDTWFWIYVNNNNWNFHAVITAIW